MKVRKSLIIPGLLIASALPIGWALAQSGPPAPGAGPDMMGPGMMHHGRGHFGRGMREATPEMRARLLEGRIAGAKAALKLDESQAKLFAPVEEQIRTNFAARQKKMEEWRAARDARRAAAPQAPPAPGAKEQPPAEPRPSLADRFDRMSKFMSERADRMKTFSAAFKPFYDSLNDEQKAVAGMLLPGMEHGKGRGHHRRWAMHDGPGEHGRGMGPGMGPGMDRGMGPGMGPGMAPRQ